MGALDGLDVGCRRYGDTGWHESGFERGFERREMPSEMRRG